MFKILIFVTLVITNGITFRQPDSFAQQALNPKSASGAGFAVQYDGLFDPIISETSNAVIYGCLLRRNSIASGVYAPDTVMPLARFTQTISPLNSIGTEEQLLEATITDALASVRAVLNNPEYVFPSPVECTRLIAGIERSGKQYVFDDYINDTQGLVECFAFKDESGKGIGAILKYRSGIDETTHIEDSVLLDDILDDLQIYPLKESSPYTHLIAQYPIRLPVASQIVDAKQLSEHAFEMQVQMQGATLTLRLMNVPEQYGVYATKVQQIQEYQKLIADQAAQEAITNGWAAQTHLPIGPDLSDVVEGQVFTYSINNQKVYNTLYTQINGQLIITANFTSLKDQSSRVHQFAKILFQNSAGASVKKRTNYTFPGFELGLPQGYNLYKGADSTRYDEYLVANQSIYQHDDKLNQVYSRVPMTRFKFYSPGEFQSLKQSHLDLLNNLMNRVKDPEKPGEYHTDKDLSVSNFTLPNGTLIQKINSVIYPQITTDLYRSLGFEDSSLSITSYLIPNQNTGAMCVASSISNLHLSPSADEIAIALLNYLSPTTSMTEKDLGFATLSFDPFESKFYQYNETSDDGYSYFLQNEQDRITITVSSGDPRNEVKSARLLAEKHMTAAWRFQTTGDTEDLFPTDMKKLADVKIAGRDGVFFEQTFTPDFNRENTPEPEKNYIRLYGFVYKNRFISVTMVQRGDSINPERLDHWLKAFSE